MVWVHALTDAVYCPAVRNAAVVVCAGLIASAVGAPAWAHHGKDFLIVEIVDLPHRGQVFFFSDQHLIQRDRATGFEASPGLLLGLAHVSLLSL